jgi:molybdate transport system regulatory protein
MKAKRKPSYRLRPRWRVTAGAVIVLGPGKADLLEAIDREGELRAAAGRLGMSYMRAWTLLREMNRAFGRPLVETARGGNIHGTARLTELGRRVLAVYREMERRSARAAGPAWRKLLRLLPNGRTSRRSRTRPGERRVPSVVGRS